MAPIRSYKTWNSRPSAERIEPYKHYYFICEGQNTEKWYFEKFIDLKKEFFIHSLIDIEYLEKTGIHKGWSNPKKLIELSKSVRSKGKISFDAKHDTMIIVFDADIYENQNKNEYNSVLVNATADNTVCVTNPNFELFLLLHYENAVADIIDAHKDALLKNDWVDIDGDHVRYSEYLLRIKSGLKPKRDKEIAELANHVKIAINQEKLINNDIYKCRGTLTSNIGVVLEQILSEKGI